MKCPNCGGQLLITICTDEKGEIYISQYNCEYCKTELTEEEVLNILDENEIF